MTQWERLKAAIRAEPDFVRPFVQGQLEGSDGDGGSNPNAAARCSCGCRVFTDSRRMCAVSNLHALL